MITAIVLYDLPPEIGLEECRAHFTKIAPDFMPLRGFMRKQFICSSDGRVAEGSAVDVIARIISKPLSQRLGITVYVENRQFVWMNWVWLSRLH